MGTHQFTKAERDEMVAEALSGRPDTRGEARRTIEAMSRAFAANTRKPRVEEPAPFAAAAE